MFFRANAEVFLTELITCAKKPIPLCVLDLMYIVMLEAGDGPKVDLRSLSVSDILSHFCRIHLCTCCISRVHQIY